MDATLWTPSPHRPCRCRRRATLIPNWESIVAFLEGRYDLGQQKLDLWADRPTVINALNQVQPLFNGRETEPPVEEHDVFSVRLRSDEKSFMARRYLGEATSTINDSLA